MLGDGAEAGDGWPTFEEFEELAWGLWEEIPEEYKAGIDGLIVERRSAMHPELPEVYTLGECHTEHYPGEIGGPDQIRSAVVLYYGSFLQIAREDPGFDWEEELWETIVHELQHHLEFLASEAGLESLDYAMDENFKRLDGEPFDPFFYHAGVELAPRTWGVERDFFIEREYRERDELGEAIEFEWRGEPYLVEVPAELGDVAYIWLEEGVAREDDEEVYLVLVRRRGILGTLRGVVRGEGLEVVEVAGRAGRAGEAGSLGTRPVA